jgi:hypothetical protein
MHTTYATLKVLKAVMIKIQGLWLVTPCLLVVNDVWKEVAVSRFQSTVSHGAGAWTLQMEVQIHSKTPVATVQSLWRHILRDLHLHTPT